MGSEGTREGAGSGEPSDQREESPASARLEQEHYEPPVVSLIPSLPLSSSCLHKICKKFFIITFAFRKNKIPVSVKLKNHKIILCL